MKFAPILALCFLSLTTSAFAGEKVFRVNSSLRSKIEEFVQIPPIVNKANVKITLEAYPKSGYYKTTIKLLSPYDRVCGLTKTLEVWDHQKIMRSRVDVSLNFRIPFIRRLAERIVENTILRLEEDFIRTKFH